MGAPTRQAGCSALSWVSSNSLRLNLVPRASEQQCTGESLTKQLWQSCSRGSGCSRVVFLNPPRIARARADRADHRSPPSFLPIMKSGARVIGSPSAGVGLSVRCRVINAKARKQAMP